MEAVEIRDYIKQEAELARSTWFDWSYGSWLLERIEYPEGPQEVPGLGQVELIDQFGGEGQGDSAWFVFEIEGRMFRIDGYHSSYDGTYYDGALYEVSAQPKTITEYVKV